jgi:hypothetical protein
LSVVARWAVALVLELRGFLQTPALLSGFADAPPINRLPEILKAAEM